jgi:UDP-glucuronate decarboxylase
VVSNFIVQALQNRDITIYGDGSRTRSFCFVDDLVSGLVKFMDAPDAVTGPLNLGNPHEITVRELADIVIEMTGSASKIAFHPVPVDDPRQRRPDISRANELLDWQPLVQLKDGLAQTIGYFERALSTNKTPVALA